eukprot:3021339-Rhodomonas_salina.2
MTDTDSCSSFAETPTRLPSTRSNGDSISSMRTALPGLVQMEDANSTRKYATLLTALHASCTTLHRLMLLVGVRQIWVS